MLVVRMLYVVWNINLSVCEKRIGGMTCILNTFKYIVSFYT